MTLKFLLKGHTFLPNDRGFGNLGNSNKGNWNLTGMKDVDTMLNGTTNCEATEMRRSAFKDVRKFVER